ncbi:hypothetical protein CLIB1423_10S00650 [[Candida] railenensis]|uniref:Abscisic acid G-protein coupled receptor-like domain-containing protein n=1 Tax=[Candida] railenensis TaxID=45579 RepID=A0A9P0QPT1_9ASCO|nr:hypothetical protein CLIB1423_10S00650 [[Candida] railenensis]
MFSLIVFILVFAFLFTISYTFTYNHNLIPSYLTPGKIAKSKINKYINEIGYLYHVTLIPLKIDPEDEEQANSNRSIYNLDSEIIGTANKLENTIIKVIFSCGVSASGMLVILILCELIELFDSGARLFCFHTVINLLILLLTVVQPYIALSLVIFQKVSPNRSSSKFGLLVFVVLYLAWFYVLHEFGALSSEFIPESAITEGIHLSSSKTLIERKINEVSIAGITIMALLSGVGSMSTPYRQLPSLYKKFTRGLASTLRRKSKITQSELNNLIQSFNNTQSLIDKRKFQLNKLLVNENGTMYNGSSLNYSIGTSNSIVNSDSDIHSLHSSKQSKLGGLFNKVQSFASLSALASIGGKKNSEETELSNEIDSLKTLKNHIYDDFLKLLDKFKVEQDENRNQSLVKLLLKWFDWGFGLYCVYRIFNVILIKLPYQLYFATPSISSDIDEGIAASKDALAITISKIVLSFHSLPITETQLVYQVSFLLSGGLFLCSITHVLTTLRSFKKFIPSFGKYTSSAMTWLKHLVISELLGIYVMSTALLIRTNLPANLSNQVSKILSLTGSSSSATPKHTTVQEVEFIDLWFDKVFAVTCVVTLISLLLRNYLDDDDRDEFDEESMIETGKFA